MEWLWAHADHIGAFFTLLASAWAFLVRVRKFIRKAIIETVQDGFASKQDFQSLETKVDTLLQLSWIASHSGRNEVSQRQPDVEHGA